MEYWDPILFLVDSNFCIWSLWNKDVAFSIKCFKISAYTGGLVGTKNFACNLWLKPRWRMLVDNEWHYILVFSPTHRKVFANILRQHIFKFFVFANIKLHQHLENFSLTCFFPTIYFTNITTAGHVCDLTFKAMSVTDGGDETGLTVPEVNSFWILVTDFTVFGASPICSPTF